MCDPLFEIKRSVESARLGARLAQRLNEALAIRVSQEDQLAPVTVIHDVIHPVR